MLCPLNHQVEKLNHHTPHPNSTIQHSRAAQRPSISRISRTSITPKTKSTAKLQPHFDNFCQHTKYFYPPHHHHHNQPYHLNRTSPKSRDTACCVRSTVRQKKLIHQTQPTSNPTVQYSIHPRAAQRPSISRISSTSSPLKPNPLQSYNPTLTISVNTENIFQFYSFFTPL